MILKTAQFFICKQTDTCEDKTCPHKTAQKCAEDCIEETCSRYKQIERTDVGCLLYTGEWDI